MKLAHPDINTLIELEEGMIYIFSIENPRFFFSVIADLYAQTCKGVGRFVLSENNSPIDISSNAELITQLIPFEVNRKSLLTRLYSKIKEEAFNEVNYLATSELIATIGKYFYSLSENADGQIVFDDEADFSALLKATGARFQEDYDSLSEKLLDYMLNVRQYEKDKLFIFVNLKSYIGADEIKGFYKMIILHKLKVLLIESVTRDKEEYEKRLIIDIDLCEI